ncbi:hypothetical protein M0208_09275 [Sphingomonas sp. SUN019]|uniref:hypothetical protein n=1 Tax=Sphingomonas sp. SUN019 TaxID=2937788 RepID=UPI0021648FE5|nr:hypothetical protein [Sphingomonas sp. SUN019]UVO50700.1 hypothetical protein M0208_09275 [Sphingomonas sp. SUN019]
MRDANDDLEWRDRFGRHLVIVDQAARREPHGGSPDGQAARKAALLDERTCRLICPIAAAMVGVCLTGIGLLHVATAMHGHQTIADDLLSTDALIFLIATLGSYFALRVQSVTRLHWLERVADGAFIAAMLLLTAACFIITYALSG